MPVLVAFESTQQAPHRFCLKDLAFQNMFCMFTTFEARHVEMSPLKDVAPWNIPDMSLTLDTSHFAMEQKPGSALRQLSRAPLSSTLVFGAKPDRRRCKEIFALSYKVHKIGRDGIVRRSCSNQYARWDLVKLRGSAFVHARTTGATVRWNDDKEKKEQNPTFWVQNNLCVFDACVVIFACIYTCICMIPVPLIFE